ncbi:MAG: PAS domain S-box protein [Betaproteobacteria bacterium]|nr:PAS domain S-box protein [Betaproteobacteria bacterium]
MNWNIFQTRSLKTRVTLFTLAIFVISALSMAFLSSWILRQDMQRLLGEQQLSAVTSVAAEVNQELEDRVKALELIAHAIDPSLLGNPVALQKFLDQRVVLHTLFNAGVFALSQDWTAIADSPVPTGRVGVNYIDRDYIIAPLKEGKTAIGRPIIGRALQAPVFVIAAPIRNAQGGVIGAMAGVTSLGLPNFLDRITERRNGKAGGYFIVAPHYRLIVTASDKSRVMATLPEPGVVPAIDRFVTGYEGYAVYTNQFGVEVLASAKSVPVAGWAVSTSMPASVVFAPVRAMLMQRLAATIFLTLLAGVLIWWMLRRELAPIAATLKSMATMSDTAKPLQPLPVAHNDEIGQLIAGFNRLLEIVKQRDAALRQKDLYQRAVLDNFPFRVWLKDRESNFLAVNQAFATGFGWPTPDSLIGKNDLDIAIPELAEGYRADDRAVLASGVSKQVDELIVADGQHRWFETYKSPVVVDGEVFGTVGFARDISERKAAEAAITESRNLLRTVIDTAPMRVFWKDLDLRYLGCNMAFARDAGVTHPKELLGKDDFELGWAAQAESYRADDRAVMASGAAKLSYDEQQTTPDGGVIWLRTSKVPLRDQHNDVIGILGVYEDITARKHAEETIARSAELLRRTGELAMVGGWELDLRTMKSFWSPETCRILESAAPVTPKQAPDVSFYAPEFRSIVQAAAQITIERGTPFDLELQMITGTGRRIWVRDQGSVVMEGGRAIKLIGALQDITERKRAEEALRTSEERHRMLADNATDVIWTMNLEGRFTYVSPSVEKLRGYTIAEVMQQSLEQALSPSSVPIAKAGLERAIVAVREGLPFPEFRGELQQPCKDGTTVWTEATISPVRNNAGEFICILGVSRDISERKRLEESLQRINEELEIIVSERTRNLVEANAELQTITYTLAHDLRAPARLVAGFAVRLTDAYGATIPEQGKRWLSLMTASANRQAQLVEDMLSYMKLGFKPVEREPIDMNALVAELTEAASADAARHGPIEWRLGPLPPSKATAP